MHLHHDKHHGAYVSNLNTALEKAESFRGAAVEDILRRINEVPEAVRTAVRNNGGGHANHSMFWAIMKPKGGGEPRGSLAQAIQQQLGSFAQFKASFNDAGVKRFGSGWAWLVLNKSGKLEVVSTANQDSPFMDGNYPIMGNDVWEHAYYLKYQNRRAEYLEAWWNVVNWDEVQKRYDQALKQKR
jgi:Fe-Mn family superoxide dismutase